jgi:hypothetical protein
MRFVQNIEGTSMYLIKLVVFALLIFCISVLPSVLFAKPVQLNQKQVEVFTKASEIGNRYGVGDLLPPLMYRESTLGIHLVSSNGKHYGPGQVDLTTAKTIGRQHPELGPITPDRMLHTDLGFVVAAIYLRSCRRQFKDDHRTLVCYNGGPALAQVASRTDYSTLVMGHQHDLAMYSAYHGFLIPGFCTDQQLKTKAVQNLLKARVRKALDSFNDSAAKALPYLSAFG